MRMDWMTEWTRVRPAYMMPISCNGLPEPRNALTELLAHLAHAHRGLCKLLREAARRLFVFFMRMILGEAGDVGEGAVGVWDG